MEAVPETDKASKDNRAWDVAVAYVRSSFMLYVCQPLVPK